MATPRNSEFKVSVIRITMPCAEMSRGDNRPIIATVTKLAETVLHNDWQNQGKYLLADFLSAVSGVHHKIFPLIIIFVALKRNLNIFLK